MRQNFVRQVFFDMQQTRLKKNLSLQHQGIALICQKKFCVFLTVWQGICISIFASTTDVNQK